MYQIVFNNFVINDKEENTRLEKIKNHIKSGDYFGTLATVLDLTKQIMMLIDQNSKDIEQINRRNKKQMEDVKEDLIFLQKNYKIVKKPKE